MTISNYFIKKKIKSLIDSAGDRKSVFKSYNQLKSVLVMYEMKDFENVQHGIS